MSSLSEKISLLTNPTPAYLDPEDDINIETAVKVKKASTDNNEVVFAKSELRSKAATILEDSDKKYLGIKVARKSLDEIFHHEGSEDAFSSDDDDDDDEEEEIAEDDVEHFKSTLAEKAQSDDESGMDEDEESDSAASEDETADIVDQFSNIDVINEVERGSAVKDQLEIINRLCESRIRLHKLLTATHAFPQKKSWDSARKEGGKEMSECMNKASTAAESILNSCLDFQLDYFNRINDNKTSEIQNDDEIPSDTDEEVSAKNPPKTPNVSKRKLKSQGYDNLLTNHMKDLLPYRNSVLQIWDDKTKLSSGKLTQKSFSGFESSVIKQIEQILQDKNRLIKRSQVKRSIYRVLGKPDASDSVNMEPVSKRDMILKDLDPEIFDDDDFYRQFLREVIESKSVGIDPISLRKQIEIQNLRRKIKKKVDTKASKGRKIRYDVDPKLTGFAIAEHTAVDEARDNILKSLCGGVCSS